MAFELIWSGDDVDRDTVSLNGISAVETIHDLSNKTFNNYSRLIMQFSKSTDTSPNHLYVDIVIKMKSGKSYPPKLQTYLVCYGIKGLQADVPSNVYDALWVVDNGKVTFNETINMGNNKMTGVADGTNPNDAVNKSQLDTYRGYYYYTNQLKHNNRSFVKFPQITNSYPFGLGSDQFRLRISLSGHYHVIYTDFYQNSGQFKIHDITNGVDSGFDLFITDLIKQTNWTPITINTIISVNVSNNIGHVDFQFKSGVFDDAIFKGAGYSSFYIKFLHA